MKRFNVQATISFEFSAHPFNPFTLDCLQRFPNQPFKGADDGLSGGVSTVKFPSSSMSIIGSDLTNSANLFTLASTSTIALFSSSCSSNSLILAEKLADGISESIVEVGGSAVLCTASHTAAKTVITSNFIGLLKAFGRLRIL